MSRNRSRIAAVTLPLLLVAGLTAGCTEKQRTQRADETAVELYRHVFHHGKWKPLPRPLDSQVESVSINHNVNFAGGDPSLSESGRSGLHTFLREKSVAGNEVIVLDAARRADGTLDGLAAARLATIQAELARTGLNAVVASGPQGGLQPAGDQVAVLVTRTMVISPDCGTDLPEPGDKPNYIFTCSTTANLGQMIANPQDLARGRSRGYSDGTVGAAAIERYRGGATTGIVVEGTE